MRRKTRRRKSNRQRTKLGLPDLEHVNPPCSSVFGPLNRSEAIADQLRILSVGIAQSHACPSVKRSSHGIEYILRTSCWHQAQSTYGWRRPTTCLRGGGYGALEPGTRCRHPSRERSKKAGHAAWNWLTVDEARSLWQASEHVQRKG